MGKKLDSSRHHITVHGREESGQAAAYMQDGVYFDGNGDEIEGARAVAAPKATKPAPAPASTAQSQVDRQMGN